MCYSSLIKVYSHDLNLYNNPPSGIIALSELETISGDRLKVLRLVQDIHRKNKNKTALYCKTILVFKLKELGLSYFATVINGHGWNSRSEEQLHARKIDHLSHFMLRSAFSFNSAKKKWFYLQEYRLFKWRCISLDKEGIKQFIRINKLNYTPITKEEKEMFKKYLQLSCSINVNDITFYKVPFTSVINLLNTRKIFIRQGMAYVPETRVISLVTDDFRKILIMGFKCARKVLADINDNYGIAQIFQVLLNNMNVNRRYARKCAKISIHDIDKVSETSYPLCMRRLHEGLKATHHLTHGGRLQYGLFIKGIGFDVNEAMNFWSGEFLKKFDKSTFNKEYKYGILHQYGVVGRHANYQPFDCAKILNFCTGVKDFHGCPYKNLPTEKLQQKLLAYGLSTIDSDKIVKLCNIGQYQVACTKYYEITHNCIKHEIFRHPNDYYNASRRKLTTDGDSGKSIAGFYLCELTMCTSFDVSLMQVKNGKLGQSEDLVILPRK